jgi:glycosyltransferase involved in cell wall biosynthesis
MNIEVLISTMNLSSTYDYNNLIKKMNIKTNSLVVNQCNKIEKLPEQITDGTSRFLSYKEKGLSRSRNKAIENATSDVCVISDDDLRYKDDYENIIENGYKKYPDADIIAFYVDNVDKNKKRPIRRETKINFIKSMRIQSVQITFRRKSIVDRNIKFNEKFGSGAEFYMGEENIFLAQCLKKKMKIYYIPKTIATIQSNDSSWFKGFNEYYFNVKGAVYYEMSKYLYPLLILQFALRKRNIYKNEVKILDAIKYMFLGVKIYKLSKE